MIASHNITYTYTVWDNDSELQKTALKDVSIDIPRGQFAALLGPNGSGKSTFAKHLNVLLVPDEGTVTIDGRDTRDMARLWEIRDAVGMVFQNPDNQIIGTSVEEDVAFGPEVRGLPPDEIKRRVNTSLEATGLTSIRHLSPAKLSGGQKQKVAIAGTLAADTACLVLDEPTAMLDPASRREVMDLIVKLRREGKTILLITHHVDEAALADRIILMNRGHVIGQGTPAEVFGQPELLHEIGMELPAAADLACRLRGLGIPVGADALTEDDLVREIRHLADAAPHVAGIAPEAVNLHKSAEKSAILRAENLEFTYGKGTANECRALKSTSLELYEDEFLGLIGSSGSGKTTLVKHLNGLLKADSGSVYYKGRAVYGKGFPLSSLRKEVGLVFQLPEQQLFLQTVIEDVCFGPLNLGMSKDEAMESACASLELVGIDESYYHASPIELSGGQMRKAAIAGILAMKPRVLVLDEPAAGLDPGSKKRLFELLERIRKERGIAAIVISHDMDDIARYMDRVAVMHDGRIALLGTPDEVFRDIEMLHRMGAEAPGVTEIMDRIRNSCLPECPLEIVGEKAAATLAAVLQTDVESRGLAT